ncbi:MAG: peptidylprolyl isomerase [Microbacteriaceae bacterium]|nr:peptidylprolyl isomerase [Microbacteriaceae bacterium]
MAKRPDPKDREQRRIAREYEARQALHERRVGRRRRDNLIALIGGVLVVGLAVFAVWTYSAWGPGRPVPTPTDTATATPGPTDTPSPSDAPTPAPTATDDAPVLEVPSPDLAEGRIWTGSMTVGGVDLGVELNGALAPQATAMFVQAAQTGWFLGKYCPRVTSYAEMQVLQCGTAAPDSTASEDGFRFGPIENAPADDRYPAGTIAMARIGNDGSSMAHQFFIVTADSSIPSDSAGGYTIVGRVTSGLDRLIADVTSRGAVGGAQDGVPAETVQITGFTLQ